jgi:hypothetical protein
MDDVRSVFDKSAMKLVVNQYQMHIFMHQMSTSRHSWGSKRMCFVMVQICI